MFLPLTSSSLPPFSLFARTAFVGPLCDRIRCQVHAVIATVQTGFLTGFPKTMVEDMCPSLKALDNAIMEHPKVLFKAVYWIIV